MITLRFYRIYDIGREIDLDWLEKALAQNYFTARTSFVRVKPKSIMLEDPPLMIQMNPIRVDRAGRPFEFSVVARVYDIGVISFCFIYENPTAEIAELEEIAFLFAGQEGLAEFYVQYLKTLGEIIRPHIKGFAINPDFYEDYSIYVTDHRDDSIDPVALLIGEKTNISPQIRDEIMKNTLSYTTDDLAERLEVLDIELSKTFLPCEQECNLLQFRKFGMQVLENKTETDYPDIVDPGSN
jgi:hypothetical protein